STSVSKAFASPALRRASKAVSSPAKSRTVRPAAGSEVPAGASASMSAAPVGRQGLDGHRHPVDRIGEEEIHAARGRHGVGRGRRGHGSVIPYGRRALTLSKAACYWPVCPPLPCCAPSV